MSPNNVDGNPIVERACDSVGKQEVPRSWDYDTNGNVKKVIAGGFCYTYQYRPDGKLIRKSSSGKTLLTCSYWKDGSLESLTDISSKTVYYHYDWQGRLSGIQDEAGTIQNSYQYGAFGDIRNQKENIHNRILYTGQQYDQVSGQYYLRARFYNSVVGRFLQEDVYRGDGLNLYAYCANNPVMYYDPSGYAQNCRDTSNETNDNDRRTSTDSESGRETELFLPDEYYGKNLPSQVAPGTKYLPKYDEHTVNVMHSEFIELFENIRTIYEGNFMALISGKQIKIKVFDGDIIEVEGDLENELIEYFG